MDYFGIFLIIILCTSCLAMAAETYQMVLETRKLCEYTQSIPRWIYDTYEKSNKQSEEGEHTKSESDITPAFFKVKRGEGTIGEIEKLESEDDFIDFYFEEGDEPNDE